MTTPALILAGAGVAALAAGPVWFSRGLGIESLFGGVGLVALGLCALSSAATLVIMGTIR